MELVVIGATCLVGMIIFWDVVIRYKPNSTTEELQDRAETALIKYVENELKTIYPKCLEAADQGYRLTHMQTPTVAHAKQLYKALKLRGYKVSYDECFTGGGSITIYW